MAFDHLARPYRFLERLVFGGDLQRARTARLDRCLAADSILLLGDGDGRFLEALLEEGCGAEIVSVDASRKMLDASRRRVGDRGVRVRFVHAQIEDFELPDDFAPDLVLAHFFFDCFSEGELSEIVAELGRWVAPHGELGVTDVQIPQRGWLRRLWGKLLVRIMLVFFRLSAGISARRLPRFEGALGAAGLSRVDIREFRGGLIVSELWNFKLLKGLEWGGASP